MNTSTVTLLGIVSTISSLIHLACEIGLIAVIATVVRRNRPDASGPLLLWAGLALGSHIVFQGGSAVASVLMAKTSGVDSILTLRIVEGALSTLFYVVLVLLLARGLIRLAQPPKIENTEGLPPYR